MFNLLNIKNIKYKFIIVLLLLIAIISKIALTINYNNTIKVSDIINCNTVYLTFDDGPSEEVTGKVLDVLKNHNVKATFFVIGQADFDVASIYKRINSEGHALGLHSYTHKPNLIYKTKENYINDFEKLRDFVTQSTGISPKICRMVGGSNSRLCSKKLREQILEYFDQKGYYCYDWDIDPKDCCAYALDQNSIANNIIRTSKNKPNQDLVILMHDDSLRKTLPGALDIIIPYFKDQNYKFDILDHRPLYGSSALIKK